MEVAKEDCATGGGFNMERGRPAVSKFPEAGAGGQSADEVPVELGAPGEGRPKRRLRGTISDPGNDVGESVGAGGEGKVDSEAALGPKEAKADADQKEAMTGLETPEGKTSGDDKNTALLKKGQAKGRGKGKGRGHASLRACMPAERQGQLAIKKVS